MGTGGSVHPDVGIPDAVAAVLDADRTAVFLLGLDGSVRAANRSALALVGAESASVITEDSPSWMVLRSLLDHAPHHLARGTTVGSWRGDVELASDGGSSRVFHTTIVVQHDDDAPTGGSIGLTARDVTDERLEAARLRHGAHHDSLTGLANRRKILATLSRALARQRHESGRVAAVFVDVDRLKYVNDALGHQVGDQLLVSTAERLADVVRPHDQVARIGGDEFLVVCTDIRDEADAIDIAERIRRALTGRLRLRQLDLLLSVSIGIALSDPDDTATDDAELAATLLGNADTAMYEAKTSGRGRSVVFTPEMQMASRERGLLGAQLSRAIDDHHLTVQYQPVFSAVTRTAVGAEALVRWRHPERGPIDPTEFVEIAEQSGTIGRLGEFVLDHALRQLRDWREQGTVDERFTVHVNVSPVQLTSTSFVNLVLTLLRRHGLRSSQLVLEARESALLGRNDDIDRTVRALRRLGVRIAIDNFGTGAHALSVLSDVGADILKLDGSYGLAPGASESDTRLVRAVVVLAHALGMRVVAERVSTAGQAQRLRAAGCDQLQGNVFAPAGDGDALVTSTPF